MLQNIIDELHIYEKKVLKGLEESDYEATPEEIAESQGMNIKSVMSASGSLESKGLIEVQKDVNEVISLSETGKEYAVEGLPERRVLKVLNKEGTMPMKDMASKAGLDPSEVNVAIGWLRKKKWANIDKGNVIITDEGRNAVSEEYSDELLLDKVLDVNRLLFFNPTKLFRDGFDLLKKRKGILEVKKEPKFKLKVTNKGKEVLDIGIQIGEEATQLTHEQLKTGSWKNLKFRSYDIHAEHPETFPGKMHPLGRTINDIRKIFLLMGFTESEGSILESAFWNFDCLFQPQDHAAREMQDTFYIKEPKEVNLPSPGLVEKVSNAHENGGLTGSEGWGYSWDIEVAKQSVLRTHTTCVSARFLAENEPPLKMFSVGRVFRRETITYKHLPEFHQVEGIVADENITFRNLLGILKEFYHKLGFEVRFRPAYFPYTYLSVECEIYLPHKETWIELGGAGMFRPEVLEPLGVKTPVAAFGLGIERLAMMRLDIKDIRMLYKSDIGWLRHLPVKLD
ncbi:MAG: phenylalanine--tRNA ligase subunit alpha [Methanobacterium sp.]